MDIKIVFKDGSIETHRMTDPVGDTFSVYDKSMGTETSWNEIDFVDGIVERVELAPEGIVYRRRAVIAGHKAELLSDDDGKKLHSFDEDKVIDTYVAERVVLSTDRMLHAKRLLVDGEEAFEDLIGSD